IDVRLGVVLDAVGAVRDAGRPAAGVSFAVCVESAALERAPAGPGPAAAVDVRLGAVLDAVRARRLRADAALAHAFGAVGGAPTRLAPQARRAAEPADVHVALGAS